MIQQITLFYLSNNLIVKQLNESNLTKRGQTYKILNCNSFRKLSDLAF